MIPQSAHSTSLGPGGPELTFPEEVADYVCAQYDRAERIVEYGSGGSTAYAAAQPGKVIWSVEGAKDWHAAMVTHFERHPPKAELHLIHADIGPTKGWSYPSNNSKWFRYPDYCFGVWQRDDLIAPDLVLIDGRFRAGCFLATLVSITRPTRVLIDDYVGREDKYAGITQFAEPTGVHGRMAQFDLAPVDNLPAASLYTVLKLFQGKA
ncbi:hypothetical protein [Celeribacter persicus]|uniref:Methyltransferase family protein n=1 Tax=Celeribacter persicus TaxID=1651082 RepID=A0A2T5HJW3_9RHOB|nr:hypothetical protein [Celeribacter persicus]PTQ71846.1 hypothetical protein C8N42_10724 [Celeribacter persicus]